MSYRTLDAKAARRTTPSDLKVLGNTALGILAHDGQQVGAREWVWRTEASPTLRLEIRLSGPRLPGTIPGTLVSPSDISKDPKWQATWRLGVRAPLTVLDLAWAQEQALRILVFSRGDWEARLLEARREATE